jgi:hypothetical protein
MPLRLFLRLVCRDCRLLMGVGFVPLLKIEVSAVVPLFFLRIALPWLVRLLVRALIGLLAGISVSLLIVSTSSKHKHGGTERFLGRERIVELSH